VVLRIANRTVTRFFGWCIKEKGKTECSALSHCQNIKTTTAYEKSLKSYLVYQKYKLFCEILEQNLRFLTLSNLAIFKKSPSVGTLFNKSHNLS
jgi:hypothetical protein